MATAQIKIDGDASGALRSIGQIESALGRIQTSSSQAERSLGRLSQSLIALGGAVVGTGLFNFVDSLQNMQNKLRIATDSQDQFNASLGYVKAIADKTGQSLTATGDLYAAVARNAKTLGYNQDQVVTVTNAMATALKASGASAEGSRSVMYQFSQILAKGKVNGDEFTTIMENLGGPVMDLVARNMGVTTAELVRLKEKGLIGAKDFTDALIRSMGELDNMQGKTLPTLGQSLQRIQNSFADFVIKLDQATGFTNMLANGMNYLAKNVDTILPIIAAFAGMWAGMRLASLIVTLYEVSKAVRAIGIAAAVTQALATGGLAAIGAIAGATAAYLAASELFDKVDGQVKELNIDLKATGDAAASGLGPANQQLTGIAEKYKEILKDLKLQESISSVAADQYQIENQLLTYKKQLENQITSTQEQELRGLLRKIDLNKTLAQITRDLADSAKSRAATEIADAAERRVAVELENKRRSIGDEAFKQSRARLEADIRANIASEARVNIERDIRAISIETQSAMADTAIDAEAIRRTEQLRLTYGQALTDQYGLMITQYATLSAYNKISSQLLKEEVKSRAELVQFSEDLAKYGYQEALDRGKILALERETGGLISQGSRDQILRTEALKRELELRKAIASSIQSTLASQTGAQAGATAAGQLGNLAPVAAAQAANQTLFTGLQFLRDQDLINEQTYQTAKVNAAVQAQASIMEATKKQFENQQLLRIQAQTGTQFGYETQKQMAAESAAFEMKSTGEKTQFALEQSASIFSSLGQQNKKAFEASKALNIATAVMNTYQGATKALATYPWPFGLIAAAAAVAAGMAQVSAIRSQSYSGRALGGPVMGGKPYVVGENGPEVFTPSTTGSITRNSELGGGGAVNVNFYIQANDTQGFDELLSARRGLITQIIRDAQLERGVKGAY